MVAPDTEMRLLREIDGLRLETHRELDRIDAAQQRCITESFYLQAQEQNGKRIEDLVARVAAMEVERNEERKEREKERRATVSIWIAAGLAFVGELAVMILHLVAK